MKKFDLNDARFKEWADVYNSTPKSFEDTSPQTLQMLHLINDIFKNATREEVDEFVQIVREESFIFNVIEKRAKAVGLNATPLCLAFITFISDSPAIAVMHVYGARHLQMQNSIEQLNFTDLVFTIFKDGLMTEAGLEQAWNAQKITVQEHEAWKGTDNFLDYVYA